LYRHPRGLGRSRGPVRGEGRGVGPVRRRPGAVLRLRRRLGRNRADAVGWRRGARAPARSHAIDHHRRRAIRARLSLGQRVHGPPLGVHGDGEHPVLRALSPGSSVPCSPRGVRESSFSATMPESSLRFRLVIARASDSTPGDVSGIVTRLHTDTELFWLLRIARPVAAAPKVCRRSVATCLALLMLDDHLRVLRVLPMASVPHTPGTGVLRRDGVIQTYLGGVLPPRALADTKRIAELLINGHSSYLDTLCRALSGDETPDGFEAVPADHELYDPEAERYFAPPLTVWYRAGVHPVVPSTGTT